MYNNLLLNIYRLVKIHYVNMTFEVPSQDISFYIIIYVSNNNTYLCDTLFVHKVIVYFYWRWTISANNCLL